jgi:cellulose synthase/poly-beta-1,6-N-acetylglucosamine synthase-like glycosyltransferase
MARGEFVLYVDADTTFDRDAVAVAAAYFRDRSVAAVGGNLRVRNAEESMATRIQHVNYLVSIMLGRIVKDALGFYFVVSGAFGLYRTDAVRGIGGWDYGPGEDGDIVTRLRLAGWRTHFAPFAVAMTDVPATFPALARQRTRWDRSMIRNRFRKARPYVLSPFRANFDPAFAVSFFDIYFFTGLIPFLFFIYVSEIITLYGSFTLVILTTVAVFYIVVGLFKFFIVLSISTRPLQDLPYIIYVPLYTLVNVYFLRAVRLLAFVGELILRKSYDDPYVPLKVRARVQRY